MQKPKSIRELLKVGSGRLNALNATTEERSRVLEQVRAALPPKLAAAVMSAGVEGGRLTIGIAGAAWAARLRYLTDTLRLHVTESLHMQIQSVRIKVVPPPPPLRPPLPPRP